MSDHPVIDEIRAERRRQIEVEGFTLEHDDLWVHGELTRAAGCYVKTRPTYSAGPVPVGWPWDSSRWKPRSTREDLVRAAALIVAEIERLDRIAATANHGDPMTSTDQAANPNLE